MDECRRAESREPDSRRVVRRSSHGASTIPVIVQALSIPAVSSGRQLRPISAASIESGSSTERGAQRCHGERAEDQYPGQGQPAARRAMSVHSSATAIIRIAWVAIWQSTVTAFLIR